MRMRRYLSIVCLLVFFVFMFSPTRAEAWTWGGVLDSICDAADTVTDAARTVLNTATDFVGGTLDLSGEGWTDLGNMIGDNVIGDVFRGVGGTLSFVGESVQELGDFLFNEGEPYFPGIVRAYMSGGYCWFCPVFASIFKGIDSISTSVVLQLTDLFLSLLALGLLFWIVFYVGKMFVQMQPINVGKFFTDLFSVGGRTMVATALLLSFFGIFTYLVNPVLTLSVGLSSKLMDAGSVLGSGKATEIAASQSGVSYTLCQRQDNGSYSGAPNCESGWSDGTHVFTKETCSAMECSIRSISSSLLGGMAVGASLFHAGTVESSLVNWEFTTMLVGVIIIVGHFFVYLMFPFKLLDLLVRLGFVSALMPLFIVLWVFPSTRQYTQKGWQMFLGVCMTFVFLSIVLSLILAILSFALPQGAALDGMIKLLVAGNNREVIDKYMNITGSQIFIMIGVCFVGYKLIGMAETFVQAFGGLAPQVGAGDAAGALAAKGVATGYSMAKKAPDAIRGAKRIGERAADKLGKIGGKLGGLGGGLAQRWRNRSESKRFEKNKDSLPLSEAAKKGSMGKMSYQGNDGIVHTAQRGTKGNVERSTATKNGRTTVFDHKTNKVLGEQVKGKDAKTGLNNSKIVNDKGQVVENTQQRSNGKWETTSYKMGADGNVMKDKNGNSLVKSKSKIEQVGNQIMRTTVENGKTTLQMSERMSDDNIKAVLSNGGEDFRPAHERVLEGDFYHGSLDNVSQDKILSDSSFKYDTMGNMTSSTEQDYVNNQTHHRTMNENGTSTVSVDNDTGVVVNRSAEDLLGGKRDRSYDEIYGSAPTTQETSSSANWSELQHKSAVRDERNVSKSTGSDTKS